jgi:hypothetical protein
MCTYATIRTAITGSAKGPGSPWMRAAEMTIYLDHPVHALEDHTVNIDVTGANADPGVRVAMELSPESARRLAVSILELLGGQREVHGTIGIRDG